jgi:hypothetical protein
MTTTTRYLALQCNICKSVIISRAHHDFNGCACHNNGGSGIFIDGDSSVDSGGYIRIGGHPENISYFHVDLPFTRKEIYDDWNRRLDKFKFIDTNLYPLIPQEKESLDK